MRATKHGSEKEELPHHIPRMVSLDSASSMVYRILLDERKIVVDLMRELWVTGCGGEIGRY